MKTKAIILFLILTAFLVALATNSSAQVFLSDPRPPAYSLKKVVLPASLAFVAGSSWGFHETSVNWPDRIPDSWNQTFWDGRISWRNKYKNGATWQPPMALEPRFWGSTTFLAWTTDSKHLFAMSHRWTMMASGVAIGARSKRPWWHYGLDVAISGLAYSAGFWITTEAFKL